MIYRKRPAPPPSYENSSLRKNQEIDIDKWRNALIETTREGIRTKRARYSLSLPIRHKAVPNFIAELLDSFDHKCPFCEAKLNTVRTEVYFYRPPYSALQEPNGPPDEHHYSWLIWQWPNLFPSCESCAKSKGTLFPVARERAKLGAQKEDVLKKEEPFLLDPCTDEPNQHLEFHEDGTVTAKTEQGKQTIEILDLNRGGLQADRKVEALMLKQVWEEELQKPSASAAEVKEILWQAYCLDDQPFAGMKRQLLTRWIEHKKGIEYPSKDKQPPVPPKRKRGRKVKSPPLDIRPLQIFLCHSSGDKPTVRGLYRRLVADRFDAWLDEVKIMPGQDWDLEIRKAVRSSDTVIVCLSNASISKEGYVQKEIRFALDIAAEKPDGLIFVIPVRLEECKVPVGLIKWQWVDYFENEGYERLVHALKKRAEDKGLLPRQNDLLTKDNPS